MKKRSMISLITVVLTCALLAGGCGMYKKHTANKAIGAVQEVVEETRRQEADRYAPDVFAEAQNLIRQAESDVEAGNYEQAIEKANNAEAKAQQAQRMVAKNKQVIEEKREQLKQLEDSLAETLAKAEASASRAVAEEEITQARESYEAIKNEIQQQMRKRAQKPEEYETLQARVEEVAAAVQNAYNMTLADTASTLAEQLAEQQAALEELSASEFMPGKTASVDNAYQKFQSQMEGASYEQALATGEALSATLETLIPDARIARANKTFQQANERLDKASMLGGLEFAPEQMDSAQQALTQARAQMDMGEYDDAYNISLQALGSADLAIIEVKNAIATRIDEIQDLIIEAEDAGAEKHAPQNLAEARTKVRQAFNALTEEDYEQARSLQVEAESAVKQALTSAKKARAQQTLNRVADILEKARQEGAPQSVPESFQKAQEKMNEARATFGRGEYVEVDEVAVLAENLAQKTLADLASLCESRIQKSEEQIEAAEEARAQEYATDLLNSAMDSLGEAKNHLSSGAYKNCLAQANQAYSSARRATEQSYRLRTEKKLKQAAENRELAVASGSKEHSAATFLEAVRNQQKAEELKKEENLSQALEAAAKADEGFYQARMSKIIRAGNAVDSAVEALAPEYDPEQISQAQSLLAEAKIDMENANYQDSNQKADQARQLALESEQVTWQRRSEESIGEWKAAYEQALLNFAREKAPEQIDKAQKLGVEAQAEYAASNYQTAYEYSVRAHQAIEETHEELKRQAALAKQRIDNRMDQLQSLARDEAGRTMVLQSLEQVTSSEDLIQAEGLRKEFIREQRIMAAAEQLEQKLKQHNLMMKKQGLLNRLDRLAEAGFTRLLGEQAAETRNRLQNFDVATALPEYATSYQTLLDIENQLEKYQARTEEEIEKTIARIQKYLEDARQADAVGLIPEQFADAKKTYQLLLSFPRGEGGSFIELLDLLEEAHRKAEAAFKQTDWMVRVSDYRRAVGSYLEEMNSVLNSFSTVTDYDRRFFTASGTTRQVDVYQELQFKITATALRRRAQLLLDKARGLEVPEGEQTLHDLALKTFREFVEMATLFERFGEYEKYQKDLRDQFITQAYEKHDRVREYSLQMEQMLAGQEIDKPFLQSLNLKFW